MVKKRFICVILALIILFACGCGSKSYSGNSYYNSGYAYDYYDGDGFAPVDSVLEAETGTLYSKSSTGSTYKTGSVIGSSGDVTDKVVAGETSTSRKVIKTAGLNIQTLEFDLFIQSLKEKIAEYDGYIENANESGNNIYGTSTRTAYYVIRVPEEKLSGILSAVGNLGTVTSKTYIEEDITLTYVDVESRIKTLETERETLLSLLEKAGNLSDIISLEQRLSEVNYDIESYTSRLRTYDNKITYSTLNINVQEVKQITRTVEEPLTMGERITSGFSENMQNISDGIQNFIVWFFTYIVNIVFWCVIIAVCVFLIVRYTKKRRTCKKNKYLAETKQDKKQETNETKMDDNK